MIFIDFSRLNRTLTDIKELTFQKIKKLENNPHLEGEKVLALAEISKKRMHQNNYIKQQQKYSIF